MSRERAYNNRLLYLVAGFALWAMAFLSLYSVLSLGCALGWDHIGVLSGISLQRSLLVGMFLLYVIAGVALAYIAKRRIPTRSDKAAGYFVSTTAFYLSASAVASTIFTLAGAIALSPCL
jgi:hypothetical protein